MTTAHERPVTLRSLTGSGVPPPTVGYRQTHRVRDATEVAPRHRPSRRLKRTSAQGMADDDRRKRVGDGE